MSMSYAHEQLPFAEFDEAAKDLKREADAKGPHYPLVVMARDANEQVIKSQRYEGPYKKGEVKISDDIEEWDCPVTVTIESECAAQITPEPKVFGTVTVRELQPTFFPDYESTWVKDQKEGREQARKKMLKQIEEQKKKT